MCRVLCWLYFSTCQSDFSRSNGVTIPWDDAWQKGFDTHKTIQIALPHFVERCAEIGKEAGGESNRGTLGKKGSSEKKKSQQKKRS